VPLISVLLPVKDGAATVAGAVRSTLASLPDDAELVILDDASTDDLSGALAPVTDRRVRLVRNATSAGVGRGLQQLLEGTDSRYVARMDADDVSLPGRFPSQLRALRGADLVFSPIVSFWEGSRRVRPGLPLPITAEAMPLHLLVHNPLCHPTMAARRDAVVRAGGYRATAAEDHDLWLRALGTGLRVVRTARPVLAYRHHAHQLSAQREFIRDAHRDPALRAAYSAFVDRRFGVDPTWLDALWSGESGTPRMGPELAPLRDLLARRQRSLGAVQRAVLQRTVRLLDARV
jgi:hypothetical protein